MSLTYNLVSKKGQSAMATGDNDWDSATLNEHTVLAEEKENLIAKMDNAPTWDWRL
jgi:hypothetical protein